MFLQSDSEEEEEEEEEQPAAREKTKEDEGDEDEHLLQEFEEEMADLSIPVEKRMEIKEEMQKEFSNIIDEV